MKEYVFEVAGEESIDTALGTIDTIRLERRMKTRETDNALARALA